MVYYDQILHTYACQHCLTTGGRNSLLMDDALLSISPTGRDQLVKMIITLQPHCIFGSNYAYFYLFYLCPATSAWVCKTVTTPCQPMNIGYD